METSAVSLAVILALAALWLPADGFAQQPVPIGQMTAFWRHRPVVDRWLKGRLGLQKIPDYLCDPSLSFPYRRKLQPEEIPFADHLTVVRLLGGWSPKWNTGEAAQTPAKDCDLAYRGPDGKIRYRWELLGPRLDHYVQNGYELTIVLDNIPWCFPATPKEASYGQVAPPSDYGEWAAFIGELCRQLEARYGRDTANRFRFRMGTENQGRERFDGTQEEYFRYYDHSAAAIQSVLPDAKVGPFNIAGPGEDTSKDNVSFHALVEHCLRGRNLATGETGSPLDLAPTSLYMVSDSLRNGKIVTASPNAKVQQRASFWNKIASADPKLARVSREVHEFGILGQGDNGPRAAAWAFHTLIGLRQCGLDRLWVWGVFHNTTTGKRQDLLTGLGWLLQILEHTVGGDVYVLPVSAEPATRRADEGLGFGDAKLVTQAQARKLAVAYQTMHKSIAVAKGKRTFLFASSYNEDRYVTQEQQLTLSLPRALSNYSEAAKAGMVSLTWANSPHVQMRRDLAQAGLLTEKYAQNPLWLGSPREMGGLKGAAFADGHFDTYARLVQESLTLKPFSGQIEANGDLCRFRFPLAPSGVVVIVVEG